MRVPNANAISVDDCVGGVEVCEPRLRPDGRVLAHLDARPGPTHERVVRFVWHELDDTTTSGLGPERSLQPSPVPRLGRGLGGGCWTWTADGVGVVFAAVDGNLWLLNIDTGHCVQLTDHGPDRVAQAPATDTVASAAGASGADRHVVYVIDQSEVWVTTIDGSGAARRLDDGSADFCFDPAIRGGEVMWHAWDIPDMPWDGSRVERVSLDGTERHTISSTGSVQQPRFGADGRVWSVRDDGGWNNVWVDSRPAMSEPIEHAGPTWGLGQRSYAISPDGTHLAFTRNEAGYGRLCIVDLGGNEVVQIARGVHGQLSWSGQWLAAIRTGARTPTEIVLYDVSQRNCAVAPTRTAVASVAGARHWADVLAEPEPLSFEAADGTMLHARLYRAEQLTNDGPERLICWMHGGPSDQWQVTFMPRIAYWRSHGWNVLVPDHRGSTGHGRGYQQALRGRWGELDVSDTIDAVQHAHRLGLGTPSTTVLSGGSAGGFTVLGVLRAAPNLAAAAVVSYPVADLADLAERSHRFERHYTDSLVGEHHTEDGASRYRHRSPAWFADQIRTPLLVMHGADDPVVPVHQSRVLAERIRTAGGDVELHIYPGEGHGFRQREHQLDEYHRTGSFLRRHVP